MLIKLLIPQNILSKFGKKYNPIKLSVVCFYIQLVNDCCQRSLGISKKPLEFKKL